LTAWFVLYVTHEPKAHAELTEAGFQAFFPTHLQWVRQANRKKARQPVPLLPRYILARIPAERFHEALSAQHVAYVIKANGQPRPLDEHIVTAIRDQYDTTRWDAPDDKPKAPAGQRRLKGLKALEQWLAA
jgi:hypothetical protein